MSKEGVNIMEFTVLRFDGDYAVLKRIDEENDTEIPLARALLPEEITEGCRLRFADFEYTIV